MPAQTINSPTSHYGIPRNLSMKKMILIGISVLLILAAGYAYYLYQKPHQGIGDEKPAYVLSAASLVSEYDSDEKAANDKYLGKIVEVKGVISEKLKDEKGKYNITLMAADLAGVGCEFDPSHQKHLQSLKEGQEVSIKGICTGVLMDVVLVDCVLSENVNK
jgi:hypothetical protein